MKILLTRVCQLQFVTKNKTYLIQPVVFLKRHHYRYFVLFKKNKYMKEEILVFTY